MAEMASEPTPPTPPGKPATSPRTLTLIGLAVTTIGQLMPASSYHGMIIDEYDSDRTHHTFDVGSHAHYAVMGHGGEIGLADHPLASVFLLIFWAVFLTGFYRRPKIFTYAFWAAFFLLALFCGGTDLPDEGKGGWVTIVGVALIGWAAWRAWGTNPPPATS